MKQINGLATALGAPGFVALPAGTKIGGFTIAAVTSATLLDITYTATRDDDAATYIVVEHFPRPIAFRDRLSEAVVPLAPSALRRTRASFLREAKALQQSGVSDHTNAIAALEANGTAYAVFADAEATTLRRWLGSRDHKPTQAEIDAWLLPLLEVLEAIHGHGVVHGNLSPDNIRIRNDGTLVLTGFPLARHIIADQLRVSPTAQSLGLANPAPHLSGPAADIFALSTVLRTVIAGASTKSQLHETYSPNLLAIIDAASRADKADGAKTLTSLRGIVVNQQSSSNEPQSANKREVARTVSPRSVAGSVVARPSKIATSLRAAPRYIFLASAIIAVCGAFAVLTHQVRDHIRSMESAKPTRNAVRLPGPPTNGPLVPKPTWDAALRSESLESARVPANDHAKPDAPTAADVDADRLAKATQVRRAADREMEEHDLGVEVDAILSTLGKQRHSNPVTPEQTAQQPSEPARALSNSADMPTATRSATGPKVEHRSTGRDRQSRSEQSAPNSVESSNAVSPITTLEQLAANDQAGRGQAISQSVATPAEPPTASAASRDFDPR